MHQLERPRDSKSDLSQLTGASAQYYLDVQLDGQCFAAGIEVNAAALQLRQQQAIPPITDYEALFALWEIPTGGCVATDALDQARLDALNRLPSGVVEIGEVFLASFYEPVVQVVSLVSVARSAAAAMTAFGGYWWAPVEVAVSEIGASAATARKAEQYGLGLWASNDWVVEPQCKRIGRPTPLLWLQSELVYSAWIEAEVSPLSNLG